MCCVSYVYYVYVCVSGYYGVLMVSYVVVGSFVVCMCVDVVCLVCLCVVWFSCWYASLSCVYVHQYCVWSCVRVLIMISSVFRVFLRVVFLMCISRVIIMSYSSLCVQCMWLSDGDACYSYVSYHVCWFVCSCVSCFL